MIIGEEYMKKVSVNIFAFLMALLLIACAGNSNVDKDDDKEGVAEEIAALHAEMNKLHGKTSGYYANVAIADEEYDKAYGLHYKECKLGSVIECLNAYYIGEERALSNYDSAEFAEDLTKSIVKNGKACKKGESLGCVNLFFAFEALDDNNEFLKQIIAPSLKHYNDEMIVDKALNLTKKECERDDATSCFFHARMLRIIDHYADVDYFVTKGLDLGYAIAPFVRLPMQSPQTIDYFKRSCALNEAMSCRYVAYWFDKYENNKNLAKSFYQKSCKLGLQVACDEMGKTSKAAPQVDEVGAPVIKRR